jgi:hypothetical protein
MPTHYVGTRAEMRTLDTFVKLSRCTNSLLARLAERETIGSKKRRKGASYGRARQPDTSARDR